MTSVEGRAPRLVAKAGMGTVHLADFPEGLAMTVKTSHNRRLQATRTLSRASVGRSPSLPGPFGQRHDLSKRSASTVAVVPALTICGKRRGVR